MRNLNDLDALRRDPNMAALIARHGPAKLGTRSPFTSLVRAIVSQQVSTHAARAILGRLESRTGLDPDRLSRVRTTTLRGIGLSAAKSTYVREAARFARAGGLDHLDAMSDEDLIQHLTSIRGIGVWSAHMVMMFGLGRPDVWPVGDAGIQRAARLAYRIRSPSGLERLGRRFRPVRSHAAWYLWRSLEPS